MLTEAQAVEDIVTLSWVVRKRRHIGRIVYGCGKAWMSIRRRIGRERQDTGLKPTQVSMFGWIKQNPYGV